MSFIDTQSMNDIQQSIYGLVDFSLLNNIKAFTTLSSNIFITW